MPEKRKYFIRIGKFLVEVTEDVYCTYYQMERHERYLIEKDQAHGVQQYSNLDTENTLGEEMIVDRLSVSVEDMVTARLLSERLHRCIQLLSEDEQNLLHAIFYKDMSEQQLAQSMNTSQATINKRKRIVLAKLLSLMQK